MTDPSLLMLREEDLGGLSRLDRILQPHLVVGIGIGHGLGVWDVRSQIRVDQRQERIRLGAAHDQRGHLNACHVACAIQPFEVVLNDLSEYT
jgi:hypothetical protein